MEKLHYKLGISKKELKEALEVRKEVFVEEQGISAYEEYDGFDEEALHLVVKCEGKVIGTARVRFPYRNQAKIERMAVLRTFRHQGIGRGIISFLNEQLNHRQVKYSFLHAQHPVISFYKSCGYIESGLPFYEAGIKHIKMEMQC